MWMFIIPVVVVVVIVVAVMPMMKKQSIAIGKQMEEMRDLDVHLSVYAGNVKSINDTPETEIKKAGAIYGCEAGYLNVELIPNFMHANTHYKGKAPMTIYFEAKKGDSFEIGISPKEPRNDDSIISYFPIVNKEIIFKTTFYITVKNITGTKDANVMRGIM